MILEVTHQCMDAQTNPSSKTNAWIKNGYEGQMLTDKGFKLRNQGLVFIDNGQIRRGTHYAFERTTTGYHAVTQQAGPDVNLVIGSAFIPNATHIPEPISPEETRYNLEEMLARMAGNILRKDRISRVNFTVYGHTFCGDIALHESRSLDLDHTGIVSVAEYNHGENLVRTMARQRQTEILMSVLSNVFQQGHVRIPVSLGFSTRLQQKFAGDMDAKIYFVDQIMQQSTPELDTYVEF